MKTADEKKTRNLLNYKQFRLAKTNHLKNRLVIYRVVIFSLLMFDIFLTILLFLLLNFLNPRYEMISIIIYIKIIRM